MDFSKNFQFAVECFIEFRNGQVTEKKKKSSQNYMGILVLHIYYCEGIPNSFIEHRDYFLPYILKMSLFSFDSSGDLKPIL
jgi:hypothetical protein